jgi:predicted dehydrogenase
MNDSNKILEQVRALIAHQQKPVVPHPLKIGMVGAGNITRMHLAGYAWAGLEVASITDLNPEAARARAEEFGIPSVAPSLDDLLADPAVELVDVTFPGNGRLEAIRKIAAAGKPVLVQKPLADDLEVARAIVATCEGEGVPLAVNMNARFNPNYRTAMNIAESGLLGELYHGVHYLKSDHDGMPHHAKWLTEPRRYQILQYGVHHVDQVCAWFGRLPRGVTAVNVRKPGQQFRGEMLATVAFDFGETAGATLLELNALPHCRPFETDFELTGTAGSLVGSIMGELQLYHEALPEGEPLVINPEGSWFPNAFGEVMARYQIALGEGGDPDATGRDHVAILEVIEAAYQSMEKEKKIVL